ncbi:hypothetical protein NDI54_17540 [Haloarcula sp. S1AR25-5A]|uniref:Uncharacterized protein n=1 Tax=Haloarcula terrestris TaxID=2950533 RepID=A0AAE4EZR7_9EURY|nr:hypothetical protein [Haloarcula terrestris]MDS0223151.1 hypothetical protein [Haloarcula terrestris]
MPTKTGGSHALATFVTLILGALLSKYIWELVPPLGDLSLRVMTFITAVTGASIPTSEQFAGTVVVMVGISFVWGVVYHLGRHS